MKDIADEINLMASAEQKLRLKLNDNESDDLWIQINDLDKKHTKRLIEIMNSIGLLTISKVGKKASFNAWLLVQHSPNLGFQKKYLELMKKHKNDVDPKNIAYLTDRVRQYEGKKQIYGTQVYFDKGARVHKPYDVIKPLELDKRRNKIGLESIEKYLSTFD